jgi:23S rRNA (adenine2503-C2)-methyltransferase
MEACRRYTEKTNRIITFEYVLLRGVNSSGNEAVELSQLLKKMRCKVNVIAYNSVQGSEYEAPHRKEIDTFIQILNERNITVTLRRSRGEDIQAGCGQLRILRN